MAGLRAGRARHRVVRAGERGADDSPVRQRLSPDRRYGVGHAVPGFAVEQRVLRTARPGAPRHTPPPGLRGGGPRSPRRTGRRSGPRSAGELFSAEHGRPAADARELSDFIAAASRLAPDTVAGYDLTFSPVKSVSALWAIAPPEIANLVEQAHQSAVADTMHWLETHAAFTRRGHAGIRQVETRGLIAAAFTHRDSRAGDPDLHTHVAVSNKVQAAEDSAWLALDGRVIHKAITAASERYNTRLEALLTDAARVRFADRDGSTPDKRAVREIIGVDTDLLRVWSSRRADIEPALAVLRLQFQAEHGRPPTAFEAIELAQQATLDTRQAKHAPRSLGDQRASWRAEAITVLGEHGPSMLATTLRRVIAAAPTPGRGHARRRGDRQTRRGRGRDCVRASGHLAGLAHPRRGRTPCPSPRRSAALSDGPVRRRRRRARVV